MLNDKEVGRMSGAAVAAMQATSMPVVHPVTVAPDKVWFGVRTGTLRGHWVHSDDVEYTRISAHPVTVEVLAAVLWREQVINSGTPQSVIDGRTPDAFANQSDLVRDPFLRYARAAIALLRHFDADKAEAAMRQRELYELAANSEDDLDAANVKLALHESENVTRGLLIDRLQAQADAADHKMDSLYNPIYGAAWFGPDGEIFLFAQEQADAAAGQMRERCAEILYKTWDTTGDSFLIPLPQTAKDAVRALPLNTTKGI